MTTVMPTPTAPTKDPLVGTTVRLWPYVRGLWPRETPYTLWQMVETEQATERLFWMQSTAAPGTYATMGDLHDFLAFLKHDERIVLMVEALGKGELAGLFWFDGITNGHRANAGVCYRRRYWGQASREASRLALGYGFTAWALESVWAFTPWPIARRHAQACGMRELTRLPRFIRIGEQTHDLSVLRITREEHDGQ